MSVNKILPSVALILVTLTSKLLLADLPYFGVGQNTEQCHSVKRPPNNKYDAGYLLSEDCKTIFVFPPLIGKLKMDPKKAFIYGIGFDLPFLAEDLSSLYENLGEKRAAKKLGNKEKEKTVDDLVKYYLANVSAYTKDGDIESSVIGFNLNITENQLIEAYKTENNDPKFKFQVEALPIIFSSIYGDTYFTNKSPSKDEDADSPAAIANDLINKAKKSMNYMRPKIELHAKKIEVNDLKDLKVNDKELPEWVRSLTVGQYAVGQSAPGSIILGKLDTAINVIGVEAFQNHVEALINPSYYYFYPVLTKSTVRLKFDGSKFKEALAEAMDKRGKESDPISPGELTELINSKSAYKGALDIEVVNASQPTEQEKNSFQEQMAIQVLIIISTQMNKSINENTKSLPIVVGTTRECRYPLRSFIGPGPAMDCHDVAIYGAKPVFDAEKVASALREMNLTVEGPSTSIYSTLYKFGTSTFELDNSPEVK